MAVDCLSPDAKASNRSATELQRELNRIIESAEQPDGSFAFIHCKNHTYLAGGPRLFSALAAQAFIFKDADQAQRLIKQFPVLLAGARVGHFNPQRARKSA